jgi:hypothetical protein
MKTGSTKVVRCAIYTRVSTDQGLEQDFNSAPSSTAAPMERNTLSPRMLPER